VRRGRRLQFAIVIPTFDIARSCAFQVNQRAGRDAMEQCVQQAKKFLLVAHRAPLCDGAFA
jgi:hypothetical protein